MKKETFLLVAVVLVVGLIIGYMMAQKGTGPGQATAPSQSPGPAPIVNVEKKVNEIKNVLAADPTNRNAWVALGNTYFDDNQFIEAIDAYDKALELQPDDPDVLTDQGVMFRELGWFDKAIENFSKASELDPNHANSLFNLGIVYRHDLQDFPKAIEAWSRFVERHPGLPVTERVRQELEFMQSHPAIPANE